MSLKASQTKQGEPSPVDASPTPPFVTPPLPLPLTMGAWYSSEEHPLALRQILQEPTLQLALATLLERARPTQRGIAAPQANADSLLGWYAGYCDAIEDLRHTLTNPARVVINDIDPLAGPLNGGFHGSRGTRGPSVDEPWGHLGLPEDPAGAN